MNISILDLHKKQKIMFSPSKYQKAIFDFIANDTRNAVINAVAGSGKTTTIVKSLEQIPSNKVIYFLAFNKAIVEELKTKVPSYVNVSTLHSVGAKALFASRKSSLDDKKALSVIDFLKPAWIDEDEELDEEYGSRVKKLVDLFRVNLIQDEDELSLCARKHDIEMLNGECRRAMDVVRHMNMDKRRHDFVDMLYIPAMDKGVRVPLADVIFIDECQDLNKAQQVLIQKMLKPEGRFIAVGDPRQAIYGFAGADVESFNNLKGMPHTVELPLSVNYRCGKKIIELAKAIVPTIEAHDGAEDGTVNESASFKEIQDGDMVLCRNTAPLVKMCLEFIRDGKKAYVKGGDIGKNLINLILRSKAKTIDKLERFMNDQLESTWKRLKNKYPYLPEGELELEPAYAILNEKKIVLETIVDNQKVKTPKKLIEWIEKLFTEEKAGVCFSTIHKSKGLENERVFIIERHLMPAKYATKDWQKEQESNLEYVAYTRAKKLLAFVADWQFKPVKK